MIPGMPMDLRIHVANRHGRWLKGASIENIAEEVLGLSIVKDLEIARSDWEVEELSINQIGQAAVDAFVAFAIGMDVGAWNFNTYL